ncbi:MAG: hypothetical protein FWD31_12035 [Planctomycetaceae bacterium]|nr:hypothetical protein [Planctomycetaceae bacterium]
MKTIPRFWAFAPTKVGILVWRSSPESEAAARDTARQAAERVSLCELGKDRISPDEYPYGVTLREKLLGEIDDARGQLQGFVTRNHTGAEVLNIKNVMFLDWDTPEIRVPGFLERYFRTCFRAFSLLLRGKIFKAYSQLQLFQGRQDDSWPKHEKDWADHPPETWEQDYTWAAVPELAAFMAAVTQWPEWGVRVYKTCAGYRGLVTHATFDPTADATLDLMRQFRCDPQYVALCKRQESFRARLTPKGWRCKLWGKHLPSSFKFYYPYNGHGVDLAEWNWKASDEAAEVQRIKEGLVRHELFYDEAVAAYEQASADYATCRYIGTVGNSVIHPDIAPIVALHDETTHALADKEMTLA